MIVRDTIYQQLNNELRKLAGSASYPAGGRFISEREVCARFKVSRPTANKALASLVAEGLLEFRKGIGTFVQGGGLDYDLRSLVSFTGRARAAGKRPSTRVLHFEKGMCGDFPAEIAMRLGAEADEEIYFLERLRLADDVPVILERRHVAARLCPNLKPRQAAGSLYELWTETYRLEIAGAEQTIRAVNLSAADSRLLDVRRGAAALLADAIGYTVDHSPLWVEKTLYRADRYEFHTRLGGFTRKSPSATVNRFAEFADA